MSNLMAHVRDRRTAVSPQRSVTPSLYPTREVSLDTKLLIRSNTDKNVSNTLDGSTRPLSSILLVFSVLQNPNVAEILDYAWQQYTVLAGKQKLCRFIV